MRDGVWASDPEFNVDEKVIDEFLDVALTEGRRERSKSDGEEPNMERSDGEPSLERRWECAFYFKLSTPLVGRFAKTLHARSD